jgi:hypothetical protein
MLTFQMTCFLLAFSCPLPTKNDTYFLISRNLLIDCIWWELRHNNLVQWLSDFRIPTESSRGSLKQTGGAGRSCLQFLKQ